MDRKIIATAAFFGMTAVILGAFGAHSLKKVLDVQQLVAFETGVRYQMYHAFLLLFVGLSQSVANRTKAIIYWLTVIGIVFFSGSVYLLATNNLNHLNPKIIGPITPIGGLLLIVAWFLLFIDFIKKKS
ncbi:MAG TPA: DUF423 domain-containing protein [Flavobacterium sp.]|nr:DUF423 domain-containing protein [Flavobacterium sp.]